MTSSIDFEVAVVGRGLFGTAAARYLVESGVHTALIGSGEPADYVHSQGPFASHYDQGRITRISSASQSWAELAKRSIDRYADIADRSGIGFHEPRGLAQASANSQACIDNANSRGGDARRVDRDWLRATTGIAIRDDHPGEIFYEGAPAGVINPRRLVAAQETLATNGGGTVFNAPATSIDRTPDGFNVECGSTVSAKRLVLATGAYGASLIGVDLAIQRRLRTIVLAELGLGRQIPTVINDAPAHTALDEIYWVPPVQFPDGRIMLKIGGDSQPMITAENDHDITKWFQQGGSTLEALPLQETVRAMLPDADIVSWDHKPCVVTYTDSELPFIGFVDDGVVAALGASGSGAKSSDELGRLAASLVATGIWTDAELTADSFAPLFRT